MTLTMKPCNLQFIERQVEGSRKAPAARTADRRPGALCLGRDAMTTPDIIRSCAECGATLRLKQWQIRGKHAFCNPSCYRRWFVRNGTTSTHGLSRTAEYKRWLKMIERCEHDRQGDWGSRGISICRKWRESFLAFLSDMGPLPSVTHSLDRINPNGNYEPGNCRWATRAQQNRNRRDTRYVTWRGETRPLTEWAEIVGVHRKTLHTRIVQRHWDVHAALTTNPLRVVRLMGRGRRACWSTTP